MDSKCNGTNEQDEDYVVRSTLNSNGIGNRKRVKLQEKALDGLVLVDPLFVPKKLRSALTRRNCQTTQPSSSDSKRNQHHDFQGTKMLQNMTEEFDKVEEEVAEILISISSYITSSNPTKSDEEVMKLEKSKAKTSSFPPLEVPKEQNTFEEQNTADYITQKTTKPELLMKPEESVMNLSKQIGGTHQYLPLNGCRMSQPTQLDSCLVQKQEVGPSPVEHKLQALKPQNGSLMHDIYGKAPNLQVALHNRGHEQMSMPSLSNTVSYPDAVLGRPVISDTNLNSPPEEKLSLASTDRKRPWNKCMTHVYISHLVKDNPKKETKSPILQDTQLKEKNEVFNFTSAAINGPRSDMIHPPSVSLLDKSNPEEAPTHMHSYDPQKQESEILAKLLVPFSPNQAVIPFKFSPVPYPSQYQEQLANASNQQVQLQHLPHFLTNNQLQQQQLQQQQHQLFWQTHMAQFRQNGMHHNSSSSTAVLANNSQPSIFSFMPNFNPHLHQQFVPLPSPSLSSRLKQNQMISNAESYR